MSLRSCFLRGCLCVATETACWAIVDQCGPIVRVFSLSLPRLSLSLCTHEGSRLDPNGIEYRKGMNRLLLVFLGSHFPGITRLGYVMGVSAIVQCYCAVLLFPPP